MPLNVGCIAIATAAGAMTLAGSRGYLAPEFTDGKHGIKSDVYSYGVIATHAFSNHANFMHMHVLLFTCVVDRLFLRLSVVSLHIPRNEMMKS